jgi:hypothetical protein
MAWQQRGQRRYYYKNVWKGGRSVRTYLGTGDAAELAATADALRRVQREIDARRWQQEQERRAAAEALLIQLCEQADRLVRGTLLAAGLHQHSRGSWRFKREREPTNREE